MEIAPMRKIKLVNKHSTKVIRSIAPEASFPVGMFNITKQTNLSDNGEKSLLRLCKCISLFSIFKHCTASKTDMIRNKSAFQAFCLNDWIENRAL